MRKEEQSSVVRRKPPLRVHLPRLSENEKRDLSLDEPDEAARTALEHPDKLHTVGTPAADCEVRLIGEDASRFRRERLGRLSAGLSTR